jgi:hypothetical protein
MSFSILVNKPHMLVDGTLQIITPSYWAMQKLSAEDQDKFIAARTRNDLIWAAATAAGQVQTTPIIEGMPDVLEVQFNDSVIQYDPEYVVFMNQMLADSDVTWPGAGRRPVFC